MKIQGSEKPKFRKAVKKKKVGTQKGSVWQKESNSNEQLKNVSYGVMHYPQELTTV